MYKFTDNVIARVAQILQEAMLLGVDVVDLMRQIEVEPTHDVDSPMLELTKEYSQKVAEHHEKLLKRLEEMHENGDSSGEDNKDGGWSV